MKVSDAQWNVALGLTRTATDKFSDAPAVAGYLAAVERIESDGVWRYHVSWQDSCDDEAAAWTPIRGGMVNVDVVVNHDPDRGMSLSDAGGSFAEQELTPAQARERAYELLVLADLAEESPRMACDD